MTLMTACILIVEDDADLGFLLQEVLKREGHHVEIVETGAAAQARLQRGTRRVGGRGCTGTPVVCPSTTRA